MLELNDIHARYGAITALRGVSISVNQGELVALLGVNGAGKSTTLACIAGVLRPWQGEIQFQGGSILGKTPEQIARLGISLVPEGRDIFPSLTVEENLRLGAYTRSEKNEYRRNLGEVFELFPVLKERFQQPGGTLSGGEQQQLAIARALMSSPRLLMLDEPSLGLAPVLVDQIFDLIVASAPARCDHPAGGAKRGPHPGDCRPGIRDEHRPDQKPGCPAGAAGTC